MKTIVVPIDFSPNSRRAVAYAALLATHLHARLVLFYNAAIVITVPEPPVWQDPEKDLVAVYESGLRREANHLRLEHGFKFEVEVVCATGSLMANLNRTVEEKGAELVVMATKGASSWLDKLIGTNTTAYLREARCPVLVVPAETELELPRRVAYAADFENEERVFLKQLMTLTQSLDARITIVNVDNESDLNIVTDEMIMDEINQDFPNNNFAVAQVRNRDVAAGLEAFVLENQLQLLALPMREKGVLETLFHHSITDALAFHARLPLLVLPEKAVRPETGGQPEKEYLIA